MEAKIRTRMGDGALVEMTPAQIRADLEAGTQAGAKRSKSPELTGAELDTADRNIERARYLRRHLNRDKDSDHDPDKN